MDFHLGFMFLCLLALANVLLVNGDNCYEHDYLYAGNDLSLRIDYRNTAAECHRRCGWTPRCNFWTWKKHNKECWLKTSANHARREYERGTISGPKVCDGEYMEMEWNRYHDLEDIYKWFDYLEATFDFCEKEVIGQSYENRPMIVMKVCRGGCGKKPAMWIDSGIHGNEVIAPAAGTYVLHELVENDVNHPELTQKLDWYFLPSHNPDGYRKDGSGTRKTKSSHGDECDCKYGDDYCGTDPNRNWDFHWGGEGSHSEKCSQQYHGPEPFSEVETRNVRDFILVHKDNIKFFQTIHSYGHWILTPWGYTNDPPLRHAALMDLANRGKEALHRLHQKDYEVGCIPCVYRTVSGTSMDWAHGVAGIPYAYTLELGHKTHHLDPDQIIPLGKEAWTFQVLAAQQIIREFGNNCYEHDYLYAGNDLSLDIDYRNTAADCHRHCGWTSGCNFWTWKKHNKECWLKTSPNHARREYEPGTISGPKVCG